MILISSGFGLKKSEKKTKYEINKILRLVLYSIGTSPSLQRIADIDKKIRQMEIQDSQTYVYQVTDKLTPHSFQDQGNLLLRYDEIFDNDKKTKEYVSDEQKEKVNNRIKSRFFKTYHASFDWDEERDLVLSKTEKEDKDDGKYIEIKIGKDFSKQYIKIVIKPEIDRTKVFFVNSNNWIVENRQNGRIPIIEKRQKGTIFVYSSRLFPNHLIRYLDIIPEYEIENPYETNKGKIPRYRKIVQTDEATKIKRKNRYMLNIRGLLLYLLLNNKRNSPDKIGDKFYKQMNEVIENLPNIDIYRDLLEEIAENQSGRSISNAYEIQIENRIPDNYMYKRFPFLWQYNYYNELLPKNFAVDTLLKIAPEFKDRLETINSNQLKYLVTEKFFKEIEQFFWDGYGTSPLLSKIHNRRLINDNIRLVLIDYQKTIRTYLRTRKEKDLELFNTHTDFYDGENRRITISRKIHDFCTKTVEWIIPLEQILDLGNKHTVLSLEDRKAIDIVIRSDSRYILFSNYLIVKKNIQKITSMIRVEMTVEEICTILQTMKIPEELSTYINCKFFINILLTGLGYNLVIIDEQNQYNSYGPTRCLTTENRNQENHFK